jgi:hypothetical protein
MERSGSFGAIFLKKSYYDQLGRYYATNSDELNHERGHNSQLMRMGLLNYAFSVAIPSPPPLGKWANIFGQYYYAPWETMADILGGVTHRYGAKIPQQQVDEAWEYYWITMFALPFTVLYWFY